MTVQTQRKWLGSVWEDVFFFPFPFVRLKKSPLPPEMKAGALWQSANVRAKGPVNPAPRQTMSHERVLRCTDMREKIISS